MLDGGKGILQLILAQEGGGGEFGMSCIQRKGNVDRSYVCHYDKLIRCQKFLLFACITKLSKMKTHRKKTFIELAITGCKDGLFRHFRAIKSREINILSFSKFLERMLK